MQELIDAERPPESGALRRQLHALDDLLLRPIDMIVDDELADHDDGGKPLRWRNQKENRRGAKRVQARVQDAAGMAVNSLVLILIGGLQKEIEHEMLAEQNEDREQRDLNRIRHGILDFCQPLQPGTIIFPAR